MTAHRQVHDVAFKGTAIQGPPGGTFQARGPCHRRALSTLILLVMGGYILRKETMPGWWVWTVWVRFEQLNYSRLKTCTAHMVEAHPVCQLV